MDSLPVIELLINADPVVKGVMLILVIASVICWTIAIEKLMRIRAFSRQVSALEHAGKSPGSASDWLVHRIRRIADFGAFCQRRNPGRVQCQIGEKLTNRTRGSVAKATIRAAFPGDGRVHGSICWPVRDRMGHHAELHRHRGSKGYKPCRCSAGHRGGAVRNCSRPRRGVLAFTLRLWPCLRFLACISPTLRRSNRAAAAMT